MAQYDYSCGAHQWAEERAIAERTRPASCPSCGAAGVFVFHPSSNVMVPQSFRTTWSDVAPLDHNGRPISFTEAVKSGKYDRYRKEDREDAEKAEAAHEARMEPIIRKRAQDTAWRKLKAAERNGTHVYSPEQRSHGVALEREALETA